MAVNFRTKGDFRSDDALDALAIVYIASLHDRIGFWGKSEAMENISSNIKTLYKMIFEDYPLKRIYF